jgi:hypothetical protein
MGLVFAIVALQRSAPAASAAMAVSRKLTAKIAKTP